MAQEFAKKLKSWRGRRYQKEAADVLRVPLRTYQSWEAGVNEPANVCKQCIGQIMESIELGSAKSKA